MAQLSNASHARVESRREGRAKREICMQFEHGIGAGASVIHSSPRRSLTTLMAFLLVTGLILMAPPADAQVSPDVEETLNPGQSVEVTKTVGVPAVPPMSDIYFLADTTGSMGSVLAAVQTGIGTILNDPSLSSADIMFGAGQYKDFPYDSIAFENQSPIGSDISTTVSSWAAGGGSDGPEGQLFALHKIATDPLINWRDGSDRIVVWFGDAPGHDPVCSEYSGGSDITEASVIADLFAAQITVVAISTNTGFANGLNDTPTQGDYSCANAGTSGQATRITDATGGTYQTGVNAASVVGAILGAITDVARDITAQPVECDPLEISFAPLSHEGVVGGEAVTVEFIETILVPLDTTPGPYNCTVDFLADGSPIGTQNVTITVPPQEEEPDVSCQTGETCGFEGETYTGTIVCEDCDVFINVPGPGRFVDLTIEPNKEDPEVDPSFVVTLIREDRPRRWLRTARLFVFNEAGVEERVGRCSLRESLRWFARGQEPGRNCSIIVPLRHDRLKYILFWYDDPRMSGA